MNRTSSSHFARLQGLSCAAVIVATLAGCGGGGSDDPAPAGAGTGTGDPTAPAPSPAPGAGPAPAPAPAPAPSPYDVGAAYTEGTSLQYTLHTTTSSASSSGTSSDTSDSLLTIRLGAPQSIGGATLYAVDATSWSVERGLASGGVRWKYLGSAGGAIVGSVDGQQLQTIYGDDGTPVEGFFQTFDARVPATLNEKGPDADIPMPVVQASYSKSDGGCQVAASVEFCSDSSSTFSQLEYFANGIGSAGALTQTGLSSSGGGFITVTNNETRIDYLGGTLAAADGVDRPLKPFAFAANLPAPRPGLSATAVVGAKLYVFGGGAGEAASSVAVFDSTSGAWTELAGAQAPRSLDGRHAHVLGPDAIALVANNQPMLVFHPSTGAWDTGNGVSYAITTTIPFAGLDIETLVPVQDEDGVSYIDNAGQQRQLAVVLTSRLDMFAYGADDPVWRKVRSMDIAGASRLAASIVGDQLVVLLNDRSLLLCPLANLATDCSRRDGALAFVENFPDRRLAAVSGRLYLFGASHGTNSVDALDPQTGAVAALNSTYGGRQGGVAALVGNRVLLIGGQAEQGGPALGVEAYAP